MDYNFAENRGREYTDSERRNQGGWNTPWRNEGWNPYRNEEESLWNDGDRRAQWGRDDRRNRRQWDDRRGGRERWDGEERRGERDGWDRDGWDRDGRRDRDDRRNRNSAYTSMEMPELTSEEQKQINGWNMSSEGQPQPPMPGQSQPPMAGQSQPPMPGQPQPPMPGQPQPRIQVVSDGRMQRTAGMQNPQNMQGRADMWGTPGMAGMRDGMPYVRRDYMDVLSEEQEIENELRRLQSMYPEAAREILPFVIEVCDRMEYEGSMMFDQRPDQATVRRMSDEIFEQVKDRYPGEEVQEQEEVLSMQHPGPGRRPPRGNWVNDLIQVMLLQEMHHRRCRHRRCRPNW